jgi:hypothetical protein
MLHASVSALGGRREIAYSARRLRPRPGPRSRSAWRAPQGRVDRPQHRLRHRVGPLEAGPGGRGPARRAGPLPVVRQGDDAEPDREPLYRGRGQAGVRRPGRDDALVGRCPERASRRRPAASRLRPGRAGHGRASTPSLGLLIHSSALSEANELGRFVPDCECRRRRPQQHVGWRCQDVLSSGNRAASITGLAPKR